MNWTNVCKITHPLTRLAVILDCDNPQLQKAFPECFGKDEGTIPWSYVANALNGVNVKEGEDIGDCLKEKGVPNVEIWHPLAFDSESGGLNLCESDLVLPSNNSLWKRDPKKAIGGRFRWKAEDYIVVFLNPIFRTIVIPARIIDRKK